MDRICSVVRLFGWLFSQKIHFCLLDFNRIAFMETFDKVLVYR